MFFKTVLSYKEILVWFSMAKTNDISNDVNQLVRAHRVIEYVIEAVKLFNAYAYCSQLLYITKKYRLKRLCKIELIVFMLLMSIWIEMLLMIVHIHWVILSYTIKATSLSTTKCICSNALYRQCNKKMRFVWLYM